MRNPKFVEWFNKQKKINNIVTKVVNLEKLDKWKSDNYKISHISNKFFKIVGIRVISNFFKKNWDQPIIVQNELGILGIIKNSNNKYLLQAKVEPGNINKLQLSPTVQATKSNYKRVHGGKKVPYIDFFLKSKKNKFIDQSEQGFRYLYKFNSNSLIDIKKKIKIKKNFFWFSVRDLIYLIKKKNIINMDTLSVLSSHIKKNNLDFPLITNKKLKSWIFKNDKKYFLKCTIISLQKLKGWIYNQKEIIHKKKKHFSIIGVNIKTNEREISTWSQPIVKGKDKAFAGYIIKKFNNTNHYLCRYILKPGLKKSAITCSVNTSDIKNYKTDNNLINFQKKLLNKIFLNSKYKTNKIFDNILSDEGGRFFHCQIRYVATLINEDFNFKLPKTYIWISQNQMIEMIKKKKIDIEARLLFGCINLKNIF
jgi:dTDP-4-dehydro-6-deoxy-alpha-D-glucopyranose 2,3-dehydratase